MTTETCVVPTCDFSTDDSGGMKWHVWETHQVPKQQKAQADSLSQVHNSLPPKQLAVFITQMIYRNGQHKPEVDEILDTYAEALRKVMEAGI